MNDQRTESELVAFLDYAASKGLLNTHTASGRKVAALKVLSALDDHEKVDLQTIDRESTFARFLNRFGRDFTPNSLTVYKARFNAALDDFLRYQEDPARFKASPQARKPPSTGERSESKPKKQYLRARPKDQPPPAAPTETGVVIPIPLRDGLIVRIHNIPHDLSQSEANRIAAIVMAFATTSEM